MATKIITTHSITCDRCGETAEFVNCRKGWAWISAAERVEERPGRGIGMIDMQGRKPNERDPQTASADLCPACFESLLIWWKEKK